jgi:hypothetical protein
VSNVTPAIFRRRDGRLKLMQSMEPRDQPPHDQAIRLLGLMSLLATALTAPADEELFGEDEWKIPLWEYSVDVMGGFGYKDNVLLSHSDAEGSAFWMSGVETMIFRLPTSGWQFYFYADASDVRYFDFPTVDDEQVALAAAQLSKELGAGWKTGLGLNYLYQNQVFDYSATYTNETSVGQILGHTLRPLWNLRKKLGAFWFEGEMDATRQWLEEPLDDYWQYGPRAVAGYGWGHGSELTIAYQWSRLDYDHREQVDPMGATVPGTSLSLNIHLTELSLSHMWDEKGRWRSTTALGYEKTSDNGFGFFDYHDYHLAGQLRFRERGWDIRARAKLSHYDYDTQTVSATESTRRRRTVVRLTLNVERTVVKQLKAHASYSWDRSVSELDFDDYQASVLLGGLTYAF